MVAIEYLLLMMLSQRLRKLSLAYVGDGNGDGAVLVSDGVILCCGEEVPCGGGNISRGDCA